MQNPFEFGRELGAAELVDRDAELAAIRAVMLGGGKLFLIGPRRFGKTSLLASATELAERDGAVILRYDAEAFPDVDQLAARILADTASRLTSTVEKASDLIHELFARLRPEATFDPREGEWTVRLGSGGGTNSPVRLLTDVLDGVEKAAARSRKPVSVIIDEFQKVVADGDGPRRQIRAVVQRHRRVGYVFAGSATRMLTDMTMNASEPFYRLGSTLFLGPLPRDLFAAFLSRAFSRSRIAVEDGAVDAILDAAEEVPYNVQLLAHACWEACRARVDARKQREAAPLTTRVVTETHDAVARRNDPLYTQLWNDLTSTQQRALLSVVRGEHADLALTEIARLRGMPVTTLNKALAALDRRGIVRTESAEGRSALRLEDPLFGRWITLSIPR